VNLVIDSAPDDPLMTFRKVKLLIMSRKVGEGRALCEKLKGDLIKRLGCTPHSALWSVLGDALSLTMRPEQAEEAYHKALIFDPRDAHAVIGLGVLRERRQDIPEALGYYREYCRLAPLDLASAPIREKIKDLESLCLDAPPQSTATTGELGSIR